MLLALLIYAYAVGERSSRRIERLCVDHVAFRVLCGQDAPDHFTIARFRSEHSEEFKRLFAQVLRLCADAGMVKVGVVAIDGTKIAADASRGANRSPQWVREQAHKIAEDVVDQAQATDQAEDATCQSDDGSDDDLPPGFAHREGPSREHREGTGRVGSPRRRACRGRRRGPGPRRGTPATDRGRSGADGPDAERDRSGALPPGTGSPRRAADR